MNITHAVNEGWYAYSGLYLQKRLPVLVYAPGRVGSMAMQKSLREAGVFSFKIESVNDPRGSAQFAAKHILSPKRPAKIISLIRDPIEAMAGYFYSKAYFGHIDGAREALEQNNTARLQEIFIEQVLRIDRLDQHLYWFENEFTPTTGIDVFTQPFDTTNKYSIIEHDIHPTLLMRLDLPDKEKSSILCDFLDLDHFSMTRYNVRKEKPLQETYREFKATLTLPPDLTEKIYTSTYCRHFFTTYERDQRQKRLAR